MISTAFAEYFAALLVIAVALILERRGKIRFAGVLVVGTIMIMMLMWPLIFSRVEVRYSWVQFAGMGFLALMIPYLFYKLRGQNTVLAGCLVLFAVFTPLLEAHWSLTKHLYRYRNYYGIGKVRESDGARTFVHGTTNHGSQYLREDWQHTPLAYYGYRSPVGILLKSDLLGFQRLGVIGLGIGSVSAYFRDDQEIDFFDLDRDVFQVAQEYFTFIPRSKGKKNYYFGDGRLLLKKIPDRTYDILIVDAFSGDSIPVHLLTQEALQRYRNKIAPDGIVLMHISNRYIFLAAPVIQTAQTLGARTLISEGKKHGLHDQSSLWLVLTWDDSHIDPLRQKARWKKVSPAYSFPMWTDSHHSMLPFINYADLAAEFKVIFGR